MRRRRCGLRRAESSERSGLVRGTGGHVQQLPTATGLRGRLWDGIPPGDVSGLQGKALGGPPEHLGRRLRSTFWRAIGIPTAWPIIWRDRGPVWNTSCSQITPTQDASPVSDWMFWTIEDTSLLDEAVDTFPRAISFPGLSR